MKITIVQMEITDGNKELNLNKALDILSEISNQSNLPDMVCFPELFTSGYDLTKVSLLAESIPGPTIDKIAKITQGKFMVLGSILEKEGLDYYNTAFILNNKGVLIGKYRKTHLFSPMLEKDYLTAGNEIKTFIVPEWDDMKIGIAICYDLRFPELFRALALKGAKIVFVPSEFPSPKQKVWKTLLTARAIENQIFIIGINRVGQGKTDHFFGYSLVTNGIYIDHLEDFPEVKTFEIETDSLDELKSTLPLLKDRRDDIYQV